LTGLLRRLGRRPWLLTGVVATLGLGIGGSTALFVLVYSVLLRPLPYPQPSALVAVSLRDARTLDRLRLRPKDLFYWRNEASSVEELAGFTYSVDHVLLEDGAARATGASVTADFFSVLGVLPYHGRLFVPEDFQSGAEAVAVVGEGFWRQHLGGDLGALGHTLTISGAPFRLVGIVGEEVKMGRTVDIWTPLPLEEGQPGWTRPVLDGIARLQKGVSAREARAEFETISAGLKEEQGRDEEVVTVEVVPLREYLVGGRQTPLWALWGAGGLLFLVALSNVVHLLLVRSMQQEQALAVRLALGAKVQRLVAESLAEGLLLAGLGGAVGFAVASWGLSLLRGLAGLRLPDFAQFQPGTVGLLYIFGVSLLSALVMGMVPVLHRHSWTVPARVLGVRTSSGSSRLWRLQWILAVLQVAVAFVLLVGGGLMLRTLHALGRVDPGFEFAGVLRVRVVFPSSRYPAGSPELGAFLSTAVGELSALPGVESAGSGVLGPLARAVVQRQVQRGGKDAEAVWVAEQAVSASYFETIGLTWIRGRPFESHEREGVTVIDESLVNRLFPGEDPIGQRLEWRSPFTGELEALEVVGVVRGERLVGMGEEPQPTFYIPHELDLMPYATFFVRTVGERVGKPAALREEVRRTLARLDREVAIDGMATLAEAAEASVARQSTFAFLLTLFAGLTVVLTVAGVYGVIAVVVGHRVAEFGIRLSLGALPSAIVGEVLKWGLAVAGTGLALGIGLTLLLGRSIEQLLFGVRSADLWTMGGVAVLLVLICLAASWLPARRASRVDPVLALRQDPQPRQALSSGPAISFRMRRKSG